MRGGGFVRQTSQSMLALYVWLWDCRIQPDSLRSIPLRVKNTRQKKHSQNESGRAMENKNRGRKGTGHFPSPRPFGFHKSHWPDSVASGRETKSGFNSLGFTVLSGFRSSVCTHLLSLNLFGGKGSFLVDVQSLGPERAVAAFGWCGSCGFAARLLLGHARRPPITPERGLEGLAEASDGPILRGRDEVRQRGHSAKRPHTLGTGFLWDTWMKINVKT